MRLALFISLSVLLTACSVRAVPQQTADGRPTVDRVSFARTSDGRGYVLRVHSSGRIPAYSEPSRTSGTDVEMLLFNVDAAPDLRIDSYDDPVAQVDVQREGNHLKLRVALRAGASVTASAYRDRASPDLLLAFAERGSSPAIADADPPVVRTSSGGRSAGERWRLDRIVIDAGHGGRDAGAVANGVREKDVVLSVAKKLGAYIEENLDVEVVYTRSDDRFIELRDRGRIANEAGAKLFISIHANSAPNRSAAGTETFFLGPYKSEEARRVMEKENRVVEMESNPEHYEQMDERALIRQTLAFSSYVRNSEELADLIERQFAERVGRTSRGVKQAPFYVLWSASMPSVLVELGFLTNRHEAEFLASDAGQTYLASAIFRAVRDYKEQYERGLNLVRTD